ncbi:MAG: lipopolysaccharide assembly protein LapB [Betaproteobacteria bacterium]|jgi:lipopolysaccharide biosynthesis regulator YciM|nr:lipopolysaccharide assembly protein LapB [Betaproteobacteria bacterium]
MEFEVWWLLGIPILFGLGWLAARVDIKHLVTESRALPRSYFRGLNFLFNEQPDKAIDAFLEVVRVDPETIELHFALGSLFRRRGEYDRAIRMHQSLLERADLGPEQKVTALAALGEDYLRAGILDRAEDAFRQLTDSSYGPQARVHLLSICEQEKEWGRAIEMAQALEADTGQARRREIAQYHCELAAGEAIRSNAQAARGQLEAALETNRKCVRANIQLGDLARGEGRMDDALALWMRIETQQPSYLALVGQRLLEAHRDLGRGDEGLRLLIGYLERYPSPDLLDTVFQSVLETQGAEAAYRVVRDELRRNPTLLGLDHLLEAEIVATQSADRRRDLELMRQLVHGHTRRLARYRCEACGFKARQFYWQCPACGGWETFPPVRSEEFELAS